MSVITKKKLEHMLTYRKIERGFSLTAAEVAMLVINWNRPIEWRQHGIDKKMVVSGGLVSR